MYPGAGTFVLIRPTQTFYERIKHVVLGLLFLKYISDSFEARRDELRGELEAEGIGGTQLERLSQIPHLNPNPPKDTDGGREDSGRGWVRELQGRWPGVLG